MHFEFLTSLHGVVSQFGSNTSRAESATDLAQQTTQLYTQTALLRDPHELLGPAPERGTVAPRRPVAKRRARRSSAGVWVGRPLRRPLVPGCRRPRRSTCGSTRSGLEPAYLRAQRRRRRAADRAPLRGNGRGGPRAPRLRVAAETCKSVIRRPHGSVPRTRGDRPSRGVRTAPLNARLVDGDPRYSRTRFYHGGAPGLDVGDYLEPSIGSKRPYVCITSNRSVARDFATFRHGRLLPRDLYEVDPEAVVPGIPGCDAPWRFHCRRARIIRVLERAVTLERRVR